MNVPLINLIDQYRFLKQEVLSCINDVLESQIFINGPILTEFEEKAAEYCNCSYAVGVSSGTDAILVSLLAANIGCGDEVITSPYTFFSTAGSILRSGAIPIFADILPDTYNIDPDKIREKLTPKTKAIIPVHLFGQMAEMNPIMEIAREHGLAVIEDAAQAIGSEYVGKRAGSFGNFGCFSFYPSKNLGAYGDGGLVTVNDDTLFEKIKILQSHGSFTSKHSKEIIGGNFRLDALQAAVLSVKLKYLEKWTEERRDNAEFYNRKFADTAVKAPRESSSHRSVFHHYVINVENRNALQRYLTEKGVGCGIYYPKPLHLSVLFRSWGYLAGDFPVAEAAASRTLAIPIYPELSPEQREYVAECVLDVSA